MDDEYIAEILMDGDVRESVRQLERILSMPAEPKFKLPDLGEFPQNIANEVDNIMYLVAAAVLIYMAWRIQDKNLSTLLGALIGVCINKVRGESRNGSK